MRSKIIGAGAKHTKEQKKSRRAFKLVFVQSSDNSRTALWECFLLQPVALSIRIEEAFVRYKQCANLQGLSVRSVLFNVFQSVIVFLYICDNDTSIVVKLSVGVGLLIEMWKIPKCLNITVSFAALLVSFCLIPLPASPKNMTKKQSGGDQLNCSEQSRQIVGRKNGGIRR